MARSVCFFSSYFTGNDIPLYVRIYLIELKKHVSEVILLCSNNSISEDSNVFLSDHNIALETLKNEGFDFGMWYKAFQKYPVHEYESILLANDSCILISELSTFFDWAKSTKSDCYGLLDSVEIKHHLQSYFMLLNKTAIKELQKYFDQHGIIKDIQLLIDTYEVGFSHYLVQNGYKIQAQYLSSDFRNEAYYNAIPLVQKGMPLIKKKIIFLSYRRFEIKELAFNNFNFDQTFYLSELKKTQDKNGFFPISKQIEGLRPQSTLMFSIWVFAYQILGQIRKTVMKNQFLTNCFKQLKRQTN